MKHGMGDWVDVGTGTGDWVDVPEKQEEPKGVAGCPVCEGRGLYRSEEDGVFSDRLICIRCTRHRLILRRLLDLPHDDLKIVCDLVMRLASGGKA